MYAPITGGVSPRSGLQVLTKHAIIIALMRQWGMENKHGIFSQCPCAGATLDKLVQPAILAILAGGPLHGYELARQIGGIPHFLDEAPDVSGVYRMLKTLEARGMVTSDWDISQGGRPKRLFTITDQGRQCLARWSSTLRNYHKTIASLLKVVQTATNLSRS